MKRNPYVQAFDFLGGEMITFDRRPPPMTVFLMSQVNLERFCAGYNDYRAEAADLMTGQLIALPGRCFLVSMDRLEGEYTVRRGVRESRGILSMKRFGAG